MRNNKEIAKRQALKKLEYLASSPYWKDKDIWQECFKRAKIMPPKYKSFMAKENFFNFNKGEILTFGLIDTPILKDLGIYLIGIGENLYITYYNEEKKTFVIDESKVPIPKDKATIEGILSSVEVGGN